VTELAPWLVSPKPIADQPIPSAPWETTTPSVAEDIANIAPRALRTGAEMVPAGPAELSGLVPSIVRKAMEWGVEFGVTDPSALTEFDQSYAKTGAGPMVSTAGLDSIRRNITDPILGEGEDVAAQTTPGRYAQTAIENAPGALFNPGSLVSKLAQWGGGSLASEGAADVAKAAGAPEWAQDTARFVGGGVGSLAPQASNQALNPRPIPAVRQPHINVLQTRNIPISAGQLSGDQRLMMQEDVAGGVPALENQGDAFTRAAMGEQGGFPPLAERASRPVMKAELDRMGAEFDRLESVTTVPFDQGLQDELLNAVTDYVENNPHVASVVEGTVNDLAKNAAVNGGTITGEGFKNIRTRINKLIGNENTDPGVTGALMEIKDRLDDAVARNLPPEEQSAWRRVRAQYRNYLPIERAKASGAAQGASEGTITPPQLRSGVRAVEGRREIASGERGMTDLAEAGSAILERQRSSGTAERLAAQRAGLPTLAGAALGGGGLAAQILSGGVPSVPAIAAGMGGLALTALPRVRDAFIRSDVGQQILSRQGPRIDTGGPVPVPGSGVIPFVSGGTVGPPTAQVLQQLQRSAAEPPAVVEPAAAPGPQSMMQIEMPEIVEPVQTAYRDLGPRAFRPQRTLPPQQMAALPALLAQALRT
jgi:hypothetical protein